MPEALKCPSCSAPLEYPAGGGATVRCPYCNTTVMLEAARSAAVGAGRGGDFAPAMHVAEMRKIAELVRAGRKIEAIKIYRETFRTDLVGAKTAVEKLAAGQPVVFGDATSSMNVVSQLRKEAASGVKFGLGLALSIMVFAGIILAIIIHSVRGQLSAQQSPLTPMPNGLPAMATVPEVPAVAAAPAFAHQVLEFGSEGIGAGQFKDSRSVAVDSSGRIFVGEYSDGRIQVFDPQGNFLSEFSIGRDKYLQNLTADHQNNLYVVLPGQIIRYDATTHMPLGELEATVDGNLIEYTDACAALDGDVYAVADSQIAIIGPDGKVKKLIDESRNIGESLSFDRIAVSGTQDIYTLDRQKGVFKFAPDGRYINRWGASDDSNGAVPVSYNDLAIDGNGLVYVSGDGPAINVFDSNGKSMGSFGGDDVVFGMTVNDKNELFACFRNNFAVRKFVADKKSSALSP